MFIYLLRNTVNGKAYVGQTSRNPHERFAEHRKLSMTPDSKRKYLIHKAIKKNGWDTFDKAVLEVCSTQEELDDAETKWMNIYNSLVPHGYNLKTGGNGGCHYSEESRKKLSEAAKRRTPRTGWSHTEESKLMMSDKGGHSKGKPKSSEWKAKVSKTRIANGSSAGDKNICAKLSWQKVGNIRSRHKGGESITSLAAEFKINYKSIWNVVNGRSWINKEEELE